MLHHYLKKLSIILFLSLGMVWPVYANYGAGLMALKRQELETAWLLMQEAAETGDVRAWNAIGNMLYFGIGTKRQPAEGVRWLEKAADAGAVLSMNRLSLIAQEKKDIKTAELWARRSAKKGNRTGQFLLVRMILTQAELAYFDENGRPDIQKYTALAKRSMAERAAESEAYAILSTSAEQGDEHAKEIVAQYLIHKIGPLNRAKLTRLIEKPQTFPPNLQQEIKATIALQGLGDSYVSIPLFRNVDPMLRAVVGENAKRSEISKINQCQQTDIKLVKTSITQPIKNAVYLPVQAALLKDFYLLRGEWQEKWVYSVCGTDFSMTVDFQADGMGGAYYQAEV